MNTVEYSIGLDWRGKTKSLYLYRQEGSCISTIARFNSPAQAERFARDCGYPLSDKVKAFIEKYRKELEQTCTDLHEGGANRRNKKK